MPKNKNVEEMKNRLINTNSKTQFPLLERLKHCLCNSVPSDQCYWNELKSNATAIDFDSFKKSINQTLSNKQTSF